MNICVNEIKLLSKNFLVCKFNVSEKLKKYFNEYEFFIEFNYDISSVPESILSIPLLTNILPIAWFTGATIYIENIDKEFYECLDSIKKEFKALYPKIKMNGGIVAKNIIENKKEMTSSNSAIFFSGGVDSLATFIRQQESQPYLITMWGADIKIDNETGWEVVKNYNCEFARKHSLENIFIKSNYRKFMNEDALTKKYGKYVNNWWLGVKHGLALIGSSAPVCFIL